MKSGKSMNGTQRTAPRRALPCAFFYLLVLVGAQWMQAQTKTVLHKFTDQGMPYGNLLRDAEGNLFGTTIIGGTHNAGSIFKLTAQGKYSLIYSFSMLGDVSADPFDGLVEDAKGDLYGTTYFGGGGPGTVFEITSAGKKKVLHNFTDGDDGANPTGGLALDSGGNLYGVAQYGGSDDYGTVFKITSSGTFKVLHAFTGGSDGAYPGGTLVRDAAGNLYGTAFQGGIYGKGTVFEITAAGKMRVLHSFTGGTDGAEPTAGLTESNDILYGTTAHGGTGGYGVVFKLPLTGKLAGKLTTLHTFNFVDGAIPFGGVVLDAKGNIYGTTYKGGTQQASCDEGCGVVFKITSAGVESTLYNFTGVQYGDGMYPYGGLVMDSKGNLYGTTVEGGEGTGTIFKVAP